MKFLVTNDDSIFSPGLAAVVDVLQHFGQVYVVCPDQERSAVSHSITLQKPLKVTKMSLFGANVQAWTVNGTPVDCVKLAFEVLVPKDIDLVISGMNIGSNIGHDYYYSGTISGAIEASLHGISAIATSLDIYDAQQADFTAPKKMLFNVMKALVNRPNSEPILFNINLPYIDEKQCKGVKVASLDFSVQRYTHVEVSDPNGQLFYWLKDQRAWLTSEFPNHDFTCLKEGYITVTPLDVPHIKQQQATDIEKWFELTENITEGRQLI